MHSTWSACAAACSSEPRWCAVSSASTRLPGESSHLARLAVAPAAGSACAGGAGRRRRKRRRKRRPRAVAAACPAVCALGAICERRWQASGGPAERPGQGGSAQGAASAPGALTLRCQVPGIMLLRCGTAHRTAAPPATPSALAGCPLLCLAALSRVRFRTCVSRTMAISGSLETATAECAWLHPRRAPPPHHRTSPHGAGSCSPPSEQDDCRLLLCWERVDAEGHMKPCRLARPLEKPPRGSAASPRPPAQALDRLARRPTRTPRVAGLPAHRTSRMRTCAALGVLADAKLMRYGICTRYQKGRHEVRERTTGEQESRSKPERNSTELRAASARHARPCHRRTPTDAPPSSQPRAAAAAAATGCASASAAAAAASV